MRNCKLWGGDYIIMLDVFFLFFFFSFQTVRKGKRQVVMQALHAVETA